MDSRSLAKHYNAYYYRHNCGASWEDDEQAWFTFFNHVADQIVQQIGPASLFDAGCGRGLLVQLLRQRGVEAFGADISSYAIENAYPQAKPYCWHASITENLSRQYDLIICIEVMEHLSPAESELAIANLCQHTRDILFSSSPFDYQEPTHINVQLPEYWAELFAHHQFFRDPEFDSGFISHWATRFRYSDEPFERIVRGYERKFLPLWKANLDLRAQVLKMQETLAAQENQLREITNRLEALQTEQPTQLDQPDQTGIQTTGITVQPSPRSRLAKLVQKFRKKKPGN